MIAKRAEVGLPDPILYGPGCAHQLADILREEGWVRPKIVTTRSLLDSRALARVVEVSGATGPIATITAHVPLSDVIRVARDVRSEAADVVIALGGGSVIDGSKLAARLATDPAIETADVAEAWAMLRATPTGPAVPAICLPTTLGGAELGGGGGFTDDDSGQKEGAYHPSMLPWAVIYDPELTSETPRRLWTSTGVRALDHAIEGLAHPDTDPLTRSLAVVGAAELFTLLPAGIAEPADLARRGATQVAAWKSYTAPGRAASGLSHQLGRAVGAANGIAHGVTSCVILPQVVRYYEASPATRRRLAPLRTALGLDPDADSPVLAKALEELVKALGLPQRFTVDELPDEALEEAARRGAGATGLDHSLMVEILRRCRPVEERAETDVAAPMDAATLAESVSNAGRWGADDELGTLNYITPQKTIAAAALIRSGRVVATGHDFSFGSTAHKPRPSVHRMLWRESGTTSTDLFVVEPHGYEITHVDALAHVSYNGLTYNDRPWSEVMARDGLTFGSVLPLGRGAATRGVLLDVAASQSRPWLERGETVTRADLDRAAAWAGVEIESGDALVVRTGLAAREAVLGTEAPDLRTGLGVDCISWLHEKEISLYGGDCFERLPSTHPELDSPLHQIGIARMGLVLVDNIGVEELADACAQEKSWRFFFTMSPLKVPGATGSPVNPLCIF
ncbi:MAG: iron-containing alcohol dehydrogenase [Nocardioides sp.]|uniref:iron-containing alcohol dehydrogenase n=1 Tax=Nocardioides sp. TaxID=35761 RepID=UPI0039E58975